MDRDFVWVDPPWSGAEWLFEMPGRTLARRDRKELDGEVNRLLETLPLLSRQQRDSSVHTARGADAFADDCSPLRIESRRVRWHYRDPPLLWLFVPAYLVHLAEEYWAGVGFPAWIALVAGRRLPEPAFLAINSVALVLLVIGLRVAARREEAGWVAVAVATILTLNAVLHLLAAFATGTYSPGMISGVVLYLPLGALTLIRAAHQQTSARCARGVAAGVLIHAVVIGAALLAARS